MKAQDIVIWFRPLGVAADDFMVQPYAHNSWSDFQDDILTRVQETGADEWEAVDWDYIPEQYIEDSIGINEEVWEGIKSCVAYADQWSVDLSVVIDMITDEGYDIDFSVENTLDDHVVGQWTLDEYAYHLIEEGLLIDEDMESYFDWEQFGYDVRVSGDLDLMLEDEYDPDSPEYEAAYNEIVDQGDIYVAEYALGGESPSAMLGDKLVNYINMDAWTKDLGYEYTQYGSSANPILWHQF